jgi:hypothetical protein
MKIPRDDVIKLILRCRIFFNSKDQLAELLDDSCFDEGSFESKLFSALSELYKGVSNGYLSEVYEAITGEEVEVFGEVFDLYQCPCCGRLTLSELYNVDKGTGYDICDYCNWEDDGTKDIDVESSVNRGTMTDYRRRIQENPIFYYREKWLTS